MKYLWNDIKKFKKIKGGIFSEYYITPTGYIFVGDGAKIGDEAKIGDFAKIGNGAEIGDEAKIGDGAKIGDFAKIGDLAKIGDGIICDVSPLHVAGTLHPVNINGDKIQIGCLCHSVSFWKKNGTKIGKENGYTEKQIGEYEQYILLCESWLKIHGRR